jgi:hypothetical protein
MTLGFRFIVAVVAAALLSISLAPASTAASTAAQTAARSSPGSALIRSDTTPFPPSKRIVAAGWTSSRYDPPANQAGDILPTVWSDDGSTYVLMDDGGVDVPLPNALWRQSFARIAGRPPNLRFEHVGGPSEPAPKTWAQIGSNPDNDDGPLGPYYSIGFVEVDGVFYATRQRNWNWNANGPFTGLTGIAYSRDHGRTWHTVDNPFDAPLGNLNFIDGGARGGVYPDGYVYAIGTEREFDASKLILGRVRPGISNLTDPARWRWFAGRDHWTSTPSNAAAVIAWNNHITYPQMTYDAPLHRYLLTFTYSYAQTPPAIWKDGAELIILEAPTPHGPFKFVARSKQFGPSNGYGAGLPSQWISKNGRDLWLKWAANFAGCKTGLDCSGKYGFNLARIHLTTAKPYTGPAKPHTTTTRHVILALSASLPLLLLLALTRRRARLI